MNRSKTKGTAYESAIVGYLIEHGFPYAERRALRGTNDRGDIAGVAGWMLEAKALKSITLASIMDEVSVQTANCGQGFGAAIIKRRQAAVGRSYVVMELDQFVDLIGVISPSTAAVQP